MDNELNFKVMNDNPHFTHVKYFGSGDVTGVRKTGDIYKDLSLKGARKIKIDLTESLTDFHSLAESKDDLQKSLSSFSKIAIVVKDASAAFNIKAISSHTERLKVFYDDSEATKWLHL